MQAQDPEVQPQGDAVIDAEAADESGVSGQFALEGAEPLPEESLDQEQEGGGLGDSPPVVANRKSSDSHEIFEIRDFTTASSFERLSRHVELIVKKWNIPSIREQRAAAPSSEAITLSEVFDHTSSYKYRLTYWSGPLSASTETHLASRAGAAGSPAVSRSLSVCLKAHQTEDFPFRCRRVSRYFGVNEHLQLEVVWGTPPQETLVIDVDIGNTILSALTLAAGALGLRMPCFVTLRGTPDWHFVGQWAFFDCGGGKGREAVESRSVIATPFVVNYSLEVDLSGRHPACSGALSELADLFACRLGLPSSSLFLSHPGIELMTSVRFTFSAEVFAPIPSGLYGETEEDSGGVEGGEDEDALVFDTPEPLDTLHLRVKWPEFRHGTFVDTSLMSELKSDDAPVWELSALQKTRPLLLLKTRLARLASLAIGARGEERPLLDFLPASSAPPSAQKSRKGATTLETVGKTIADSLEGVMLPSQHRITAMVADCFSEDRKEPPFSLFTPTPHRTAPPNSKEDKGAPSKSPSSSSASSDSFNPEALVCRLSSFMPASPPLSFLSDLAIHVAELGSQKAASMLWDALVREIRFMCEAAAPLPRVGPTPEGPLHGPPGSFRAPACLTFCPLHQRLMKANAAIAQKRIDSGAVLSVEDPVATAAGFVPPVLSVYPPVTSEEAPLEAERRETLKRERPQEWEKERNRPLVTEMRDFRRANPGKCLAEFIQWRGRRLGMWGLSPEGGDPRGGTPAELLAADSGERVRWEGLWRAAETAVSSALRRAASSSGNGDSSSSSVMPALFDPEAAAELALHQLESVPAGAFFSQLFDCALLDAVFALVNSPVTRSLESLQQAAGVAVDRMVSVAEAASRDGRGAGDVSSKAQQFLFRREAEDIVEAVAALERLVSTAVSLDAKFPSQTALISALLESSVYVLVSEEEKALASQIMHASAEAWGSAGAGVPRPLMRRGSGSSPKRQALPWPPVQKEYLFKLLPRQRTQVGGGTRSASAKEGQGRGSERGGRLSLGPSDWESSRQGEEEAEGGYALGSVLRMPQRMYVSQRESETRVAYAMAELFF